MTTPLSAEQYWKEYFDRINRQRGEQLARSEYHREICAEMDTTATGGVPRKATGPR